MAIDQDIAQRVDAYRDNPQALQQRYAANQELLDLLALQRLKSEKDDAMRKVQLEMQQDPQTIKQQRERQLLEMTKQDLTKQTAGIMQNTQKKQQKNMQRVAKQGAPSPQQMQQVQSGLGALAQRQQQQGQAPVRRAHGGIVAFKEGGITQADIDAYREKLKQNRQQFGLGPTSLKKLRYMLDGETKEHVLSDEEIRRILSNQRANPDQHGNLSAWAGVKPGDRPWGGLEAQAADSVIGAATSVRDRMRRNQMEGMSQEYQETYEASDEPEPKSSSPTTEPGSRRVPLVPGSPGSDLEGHPPLAQVGDGGIDTASAGGGKGKPEGGISELIAPPIDMTDVNANQRGEDILSRAGIGVQDPDSAKTTARDDAASFLGRDEKRGKMDEYLEQLRAMDASHQDPDKLRRQEISAFLRSTAGVGSFGQTMARGSQGMADERDYQERSSHNRLMNRLGAEQNAMGMDMEIAKSAQGSGDTAYGQSMANQRTIADVLARTQGKEVDLIIKRAQLAYDANDANIKNRLEAQSIAVRETVAKLGVAEGLAKIQSNRDKLIEQELANDPTVIAALFAHGKNPTPESHDAVLKAQDAVRVAITQYYQRAGINNIETILLQILKDGGSTGATTPTNVYLSPEGEAALGRN